MALRDDPRFLAAVRREVVSGVLSREEVLRLLELPGRLRPEDLDDPALRDLVGKGAALLEAAGTNHGWDLAPRTAPGPSSRCCPGARPR